MIAGAWLCLLAPLAGALLITLAGTRISRSAAAWISTGSVFVGFAGAADAFIRVLGESPRRSHASLDRVHVVRGRQLPGADADPRRPGLADDDADRHGRRRPDRLVLDGLHEGRGRGAPLLRVHGVLRVRDADARDGRQPAAAPRRLGPRRARVLPPDRLLPRPARGGGGGQEGVHHERDRRRRDGPRLLPADREDRHARLPDRGRRGRALVEHREPRCTGPARGGDREVGAAPSPHLAPGRDGGPDTRLRPHPRGDDGDGRRLPDRADPPDLRGRSRRAAPVGDHRRGHDHRRGRDRARPVGHQARDRVLDHVADRLHVPRGGRRRLRLRDVPPDDPRLLQGAPLPLGRRHHPPSRGRAGHPADGRPPQGDAVHARRLPRRSPRPRRYPAALGLLVEGRDHLVRPRRGRCPRLHARRARIARGTAHRRVHLPALLPRLPRTSRPSSCSSTQAATGPATPTGRRMPRAMPPTAIPRDRCRC